MPVLDGWPSPRRPRGPGAQNPAYSPTRLPLPRRSIRADDRIPLPGRSPALPGTSLTSSAPPGTAFAAAGHSALSRRAMRGSKMPPSRGLAADVLCPDEVDTPPCPTPAASPRGSHGCGGASTAPSWRLWRGQRLLATPGAFGAARTAVPPPSGDLSRTPECMWRHSGSSWRQDVCHDGGMDLALNVDSPRRTFVAVAVAGGADLCAPAGPPAGSLESAAEPAPADTPPGCLDRTHPRSRAEGGRRRGAAGVAPPSRTASTTHNTAVREGRSSAAQAGDTTTNRTDRPAQQPRKGGAS